MQINTQQTLRTYTFSNKTGTDIAPNRFLKQTTSGGVAYATAADSVIAISMHASNENAVYENDNLVSGSIGIVFVECAEPIPIGSKIGSNYEGKAVVCTSSHVELGYAASTTAAAGDKVLFVPSFGTPPTEASGAVWGGITGTLADQTDLDTILTTIQSNIAGLTASLDFQANWNADTNTPDISTASEGEFWIVNVAGDTDLGGITDWGLNDWAVKTDTSWAKVDNSSAYTATDKAKVDFISVTQPVDLDTMESDIADKQATLVSGTNIKTVNSTSLLGSGDIVISAGGGATVNVETLTADKTLLATDDDYQYLSGSSNYNVYLPQTGVSEGKKFTFVNTNVFSSTYYFKIYNGAVSVQILYSKAMCSFIYTGTEWVADVNASKENSAVGYEANGSNLGVAVGYAANGSSLGVAVGYEANGLTNGVAVGYEANGLNNGVAVGLSANGLNNGVAVGLYAKTNNKGKNTVALGSYSKCERAKEFTITHTEGTNNKSNTSIVGLKEISNVVDAVFAEQYLDAASARLTLLTDSLLNFTLKYNAIDSTAAKAKTWEIKGSIKNDGGVVELVGTPSKTVLGETTNATTWDIQVSADDTNNSLKLEFKGDATTIRRGGSFYLTDVRV